ncbi:hypothetical protein QZH41_005669 [Actinostola sp. cb2023]|nr:hypothetical protein QZH41_005669 [Actinostola sp. cb2023]
MNVTNATTVLTPQLCSSALNVENTVQAKVAKTIAYCIVLLMSMVGNILLVVVVYKNRKSEMLTTTNCFIVNMAISDLIIPSFAVPNKLYNLILGSDFRWLFGGWEGLILCKCLNFLLDVSTAVSIQSLVAIAVDRYYGVIFPLHAVRHKSSRAWSLAIPLIWLSSIAFHAVYFYTFRLVELEDKQYCLIVWQPLTTSKDAQIPFYLAQFSLLYVFPLVVIAFLYGCIISKLRASTVSQSYNKSRRRRVSEHCRNRKVTKMCLVAVLVFALCWAPIHIYAFCFYFFWNWSTPCDMKEVTFVVFFVAYSYAALNPCIFFTFNDSFKRGVVRVLRCKSAKKTKKLTICEAKLFSDFVRHDRRGGVSNLPVTTRTHHGTDPSQHGPVNGTVTARTRVGTDPSRHGPFPARVPARTRHGTDPSRHGPVTARTRHGTDPSRHGPVTARTRHGTDPSTARSRHELVSAQIRHGTDPSRHASRHGPVMARPRHGTDPSRHGPVTTRKFFTVKRNLL